jgi:hypothetical protein
MNAFDNDRGKLSSPWNSASQNWTLAEFNRSDCMVCFCETETSEIFLASSDSLPRQSRFPKPSVVWLRLFSVGRTRQNTNSNVKVLCLESGVWKKPFKLNNGPKARLWAGARIWRGCGRKGIKMLPPDWRD